MSENILFEEKQYIGFNKFSIIRRLVLAIFCFVAYYFTPEGFLDDDLLFVLGIAILVISVILFFVLHLHTRVYEGSIILDGIWSTKKVKIDMSSIVSVEKSKYSKYFLNAPAYNLHVRGKIKFFTGGTEAVCLKDRDGLEYIIGTGKQIELYGVLNTMINSNEAK